MAADAGAVFYAHLKKVGLKRTRQRDEILALFLRQERHLTAEELHDLLRRRKRGIGFSTVYRTLKLLTECGIAREVKLEDGVSRFEHDYGHEHHDHLVCTRCGRFVEFRSPAIERLQTRVAREHGFVPKRHRMQIYGLCRDCR
jgi:Fur family ferric uptake transcriptional regulator